MVKIRLQRGGRTHRPIYTIVAANSRDARNGKFLEKLGQYDPKGEENLKDINTEGIRAWVDKGALLSDTVNSLLKKHGVKF
ncbi:MAG: 30S ribosomal protein S16 [Halobacteriovoraceae bacterium]|nr:30S ribosomal protein S16 [Halobacteriovoraceae bacterium]|tara:strand:- start:13464 stop:13706 length:243 start_codon:yes stop_codon:yes gene_type:complete